MNSAASRNGAWAWGLDAVRPPATGTVLVVLMGLYVVLVPSVTLLPDVEPYDAKRLLQLVLLGANALFLLGSSALRAGWLDVWSGLPRLLRAVLGALLALGLLSSAVAAAPRYALLEVAHLGLLFALALSVAALRRRGRGLTDDVLLGVVVMSAACYLLSVTVGYVMAQVLPGFGIWPDAYTGFSSVRFFNQFQTFTLPLIVLPALLWAGTRRTRLVWLGVAACWWMLLFASGGRGAALAMVFALVATPLLLRRRAIGWLGAQLRAAAAGAGLYFVFFKLLADSGADLLHRASLDDSWRFIMWRHAADLMQANPVLGVGPMHYAYHPFEDYAAHPHNAVLQWGAEWGVPALLLFVLVGGWGLTALIRRTRAVGLVQAAARTDAFRVALVAAALAAALHALLDGLFVMPLSQVMMALLIGWALGLHGAHVPGAVRPQQAPGARLVLQGGLLVAVAVVAWGVTPEATRLETRQQAYIQSVPMRNLWPRYWQQGYIMPLPAPQQAHTAQGPLERQQVQP